MIDFDAIMSHNRLEAYAEEREQEYVDRFGPDEDDEEAEGDEDQN